MYTDSFPILKAIEDLMRDEHFVMYPLPVLSLFPNFLCPNSRNFLYIKPSNKQKISLVTPPNNCPFENYINMALEKKLFLLKGAYHLKAIAMVIEIIHWPVVLMVKMGMLTVEISQYRTLKNTSP